MLVFRLIELAYIESPVKIGNKLAPFRVGFLAKVKAKLIAKRKMKLFRAGYHIGDKSLLFFFGKILKSEVFKGSERYFQAFFTASQNRNLTVKKKRIPQGSNFEIL